MEVVVSPTLSFAMEQSGVPVLRSVRVQNAGAEALGPTVFRAQLLPQLGEAVQVPVKALAPGEELLLDAVDLRLPPGHLRTVVEAERAQLHWSLRAGDTVVSEGREDVEVLPFHHWPGTRAPLGLLASFVTPAHPVVAELLKDVRALLEQAVGDGSLSGYQRRDVAHVRAMVAALYQAVQELGLGYAEVPPSYEAHGQKVRLPDQLLQERVGCCLDLTLLFASALEAMGLHPLVVLVQGHAFPAVWLIDERFPEGVVEDAARLRNLLALGHVLPFDAAAAVSAARPDLAGAVAVAQKHLAEDATFVGALDVRVLRFDRYRPLPLRGMEPPPASVASTTDAAQARIHRILDSTASAPPPVQAEPRPSAQVVSRFARWKEKLLDLTLRNKLLNFRPDAKGALPLAIPDLAAFEDALSAGDAFEVLPAPEDDALDARVAKLQKARGTEEELEARRREDLGKGLVHALVKRDELWARAWHLDRTARTDLEEGGATTLYLSLGMLRWREDGDPTPRLAPLLLYPVELRMDRDRRRLKVLRLPEDPLGNVTLAEKLRRDFAIDGSALTTLDADEAGLNIAGIFAAVRHAIMSRPGWEVLEEAHLGLFTFTKFLMWKDLEDNEEVLLSNSLVRHIASKETAPPPESGSEFAPAQMDTEVSPAELPCVLDADSTQLAAVASALSGRSLVLQGPPGTGKSQTITNLIAAALARGKTVLFVSEKMAALDVVHRRLKSVGLEDFCLELHSHKSNKKEVLTSFGRTFERTQRAPDVAWDTHAGELGRSRESLNAYVEALHRTWPLGHSAYSAWSRLLALQDAPELRAAPAEPLALTEAQLREAQADVEELSRRLAPVHPATAHPWAAVRGLTWSNAVEDQVQRALEEAAKAVDAADAAGQRVVSTLGLPVPEATADLRALSGLAEALAGGPLPSVALGPAWPEARERARRYAKDWGAQQARERQLASRWKPELLERELEQLHARFQRWAGAFVLLAFLFLWSARRALSALSLQPLPGNRDVERDLATAKEVRQQRPRLAAEADAVATALEGAGTAPLESPAALEGALERARKVRELRDALGASTLRVPASDAARAELAAQAKALATALERLAAAEAQLSVLVKVRPWEPETSARHRSSLREQVRTWQGGLRSLRAWCLYAAQAERARSLGHGTFVDAAEAQRLPPEQLAGAFERSLLSAWMRTLQDTEPVLRDFEGDAHAGRVERFGGLDREHVALSRRRVVAALERQLPTGMATAAESSEPGILARELRKKTRHMALRKLLASIPMLSRRLKPCFLMSPLSVAQYLPADGRRFDLLVFDEASQIGTHDAIGAIARAEQVVVVGDSKQLPPTAFFTRSDDPEAAPDENDVLELESILDEALAKQLPQQMLGWHYRSKHDSLIDFSNRQYYEGRLHVFPAARARVEDLGVKWHPVPDGVYQSRTAGRSAAVNPREAEALVAELVRTLRRYRPHERTFGVVTFSSVQQGLIQDLLEAERAKYPEVEAHFASAEPLFVKNLENVQGDERDEIFFSICYAKDAEGKLRMNFGPLNRAGGERRLNVAITRARYALRVFSTLTYEQIDLSRTSAVGARHLREFLRRAAESTRDEAAASARPPRGMLEQRVAETLRAEGYTVHADVGCGGYRVDLAVVHPERPGEYLLGVECDGPHYRSAATARDRDRLRAEVLRGLGWRLHRVWSPDWVREQDAQVAALKAAVLRALEESRAPAARPSPEVPAAEASAAPTVEPEATPERFAGAEATPALAAGPSPRPYTPARLAPVDASLDFFSYRAVKPLRQQLEQVLAEEGPVHEDLLTRRIQEAWGLGRLTTRVRSRVKEQMEELMRSGAALALGEFLWLAARGPTDFTEFRGAHEDREAAHLPPEEVANAAAALLSQALSLGREDLLRETARLFGIQRLTRAVLPVIEAGLKTLEKQQRCTLEGERVVWRG